MLAGEESGCDGNGVESLLARKSGQPHPSESQASVDTDT